MDDETRAYMTAMEGRLMRRMNDNHEYMLKRLCEVDTSLIALANVVSTIALNSKAAIADIDARLTRLRK